MVKSVLFTASLFLLILVNLTNSFPSGAPTGSCESLTPKHVGNGAGIPFPYKITLDKTTVKSGEKIQLTIDGGPKFKGFLAQGRKVGGGTTPFGVFVPGGGDSKTLACGHEGGSITQTDKELKNSVKFSWIAPSEKGKYHILVTMIESYTEFWVGKPSANIEVN